MNLFRIMNMKGINRCAVFHLQARQIIERGNPIDVYRNLKLETFYFTKGPA